MKVRFWKKESKDALVPDSKTKIGKTFISINDSMGSSPSITLSDQVDAFEKDPILRESIIHTSMEILGTGFFTSIDDKYTIVLPKPSSVGDGNWTAKQALDYWNTENNLDEVLLTCALELTAYGNSFLLLTPKGIQPIPLTSISTLDRMSETIPKSEEYKIVFNNIANQREALWGSFIHFRANVTTDSNPFGTGVVSGLLEEWDTNCDSLMDQVYMIRKAMTAGFGAFSQPTQVWVFPKATDAELGTKKAEIEKLPQYGGRFATNEEMSIIGPMPNKERGYDEFIKTMFDQYIMSIGDPSLKASVESGFTEASIRGSIELYRKKIQYMRRTLKRQVEKMWATVLKGYGFDSDAAQAKLNFGADEIAWTVSDLMNAVSNNVITPEEARVQLMKKAKWELDENAPAPKPEPIPMKESLREEKWITKNGVHIPIDDSSGPVDISNPDKPKVHYDPVKPGPDAPPDQGPKVEPDPYADQHAASVDDLKTDMRIANASYQDSASKPEYWVGKLQGQDPEVLKYKLDSIDKSIAANVFHGGEKDIALASREGIKKLLGGS